MEPKEIWVTVGVVFVCAFAILGFLSSMNASYNDNAGSSFNQTLYRVQQLTQNTTKSIGTTFGNNTLPTEGSGESDQQQGLIRRSLRVLTKVDDFFGLIPALLRDGANIMQVPQEYQDIAVFIFIGILAMTLAYLFLLGVRKLL